MDFTLTKEQLEYRKEIVGFARAYLNAPEDMEVFSRSMWKKVAEFGLFLANVGRDYKGLEESYLTSAIMMEALGYGCKNNGFVFAITNHLWVAQNMIWLYGSDHMKQKYIPLMTQGKMIGCFALTESEAGSDANSMLTIAVEEDDHYALNGNKMFISNGPIADVFLVIARSSYSPPMFTAFIVEKDFDGVRTGNPMVKMGLGACPTCELILKDCHVPKENVLGSVHGGAFIVTAALEWERCYEFAPHVGAMQRVMEQCMVHAQTRKQFGKVLGEFQGVSHKIADMEVAIEAARLMLYRLAWMKDQSKNAFCEASVFKLFVSEQYIKLCQTAMQIFGAYGYCAEYGLERELRDAMGCSIYSGTSEMQRNTIYQMMQTVSFAD